MAEEKLIPGLTKLTCTGCPGVYLPIKATPSNVFVKKQNVATLVDIKTSNISSFGVCSFIGACKPSPAGKWQQARDTITFTKNKPLTEISSFLNCQNGGKISIVPIPPAPPVPPNAIDAMKGKINAAASAITKKAAVLAEKVTEIVNKAGEMVKDAGGVVLKNEQIQNAVKNLGDAVDDVDVKKAKMDIAVENIDIRLENLKKRLESLITGSEYKPEDLKEMEKEDSDESASDTQTADSDNNQEVFDGATQDAVDELSNYLNTNITASDLSEAQLDNFKSPNSNFLGEKPDNSVSTVFDAEPVWQNTKPKSGFEEAIDRIDARGKRNTDIAEGQYDEYAELVHNSNDAIDLGSKDETVSSLVLLNHVLELVDPIPGNLDDAVIVNADTASGYPLYVNNGDANYKNKGVVSGKIKEERSALNDKAQAEIDQLLEEIEYLKRLKKYEDKSEDIQEDIDKASAVLDALEDFDTFIDGVTAKLLGEMSVKLKEAMEKLNKNMALLNTSLDGLSYVVAGMPAGDVVTFVPDRPEPKEEEEKTEASPAALPVPTSPPVSSNTDEGETHECTFTLLAVIKNETIPHIIIEKNEDNLIVDEPLPEPIQFVAGSKKKYKKTLAIIIQNLHRIPDHKKDNLTYTVDGESKSVEFPDGERVKIPVDINYNDRFFEKTRLLKNFMGLFDIDKTEYIVPMELCGYNRTISADVFPDAEWIFLLAIGSADPLTYTHGNQPPGRIFEEHQDKARRIGNFNSRKKNYGNRTAEFKLLYGTSYNNYESNIDLSIKAKVEKLYSIGKIFFNIAGFLDKIADFLRGDHKSKRGSSVYIATTPPSLSAALINKLESSDNLFEIKKKVSIEVKFDPVLSAVINVDLVKTGAKRIPLFIFIDKIIKKLTGKPFSDVFFFTVEVSFNFTLDLSLKGEGDVSYIPEGEANSYVRPALEIKTGFHLEGSALGIEYKAVVEGSVAAGFDLGGKIVSASDEIYGQLEVGFNGIEANLIIKITATGWITIEQIEKPYQGVIGKMDEPYKTGKFKLTF